jgi:DNA polymerase-4
MKYIFHIDMDAFFASVEENIEPFLKNKPFVVAGRTKKSVVSSANYTAREYGIKAAMPLHHAKDLCNSLIIVPPHFKFYEEYHNAFIKLIKTEVTNVIEVSSIDECSIDVSNLVKNKPAAFLLAKKIQDLVLKRLKLSCSIGISTNKFLAKMASDMKKPFGITTLYKNELKTKLYPLPIKKMHMIGVSTANLLNEKNIFCIGDLLKNKRILKEVLGNQYMAHFMHAKGIGDDEIITTNSERKSISASHTFLNSTNDYDEIKSMIMKLSHDVFEQISPSPFKTITISVKKDIHTLISRSYTFDDFISSFSIFAEKILSLYDENFENITIRLVRVCISNF